MCFLPLWPFACFERMPTVHSEKFNAQMELGTARPHVLLLVGKLQAAARIQGNNLVLTYLVRQTWSSQT